MLTLPESIQELVGRRISRISTSWPDRDVIVFDTVAIATNSRTRYAYSIDGTFDRAYRLSSMVGYIVTAVEGLSPEESTGQQKLLIRTEGSYGFGILYFSIVTTDDSLLMEDGDDWVQEEDSDCDCLMLEVGELDGAELVDISVGRNPPYNDPEQYVVQEDDVNYGVGIAATCPCEE